MYKNKNKVGTCKCVDYYKDGENNKWVKQVRKTNGTIFELKCNNRAIGATNLCAKHQNCKNFYSQ